MPCEWAWQQQAWLAGQSCLSGTDDCSCAAWVATHLRSWQDGYRPKNAKMLETKFHLIGHTADQPKFVNTSLKNRQKN
jgi:hypothetical protein